MLTSPVHQNGRLLGVSAFARLLVIVFLVPWSLRAAAAPFRKTLHHSSDSDSGATRESRPLLDRPSHQSDPPPISKYAHAEPWVSFVSFLMSLLGWLLVALSAVLAKEWLLWTAILVLALGIGGNTTIQAFAINLLEEAQATSSDAGADDGEQGTAEGADGHPTATVDDSKGRKAALDAYLGVLGMLENLVSVLAPLLDGTIYGATLASAPYVVFLWAAAQYAACALLTLWL